MAMSRRLFQISTLREVWSFRPNTSIGKRREVRPSTPGIEVFDKIAKTAVIET